MKGRKDFEWLIKEDNVWLISLCLVAQTCPTLCDPMDCSPPGSSVHGILQARILKWVSMPSSRGSSQSRDQTQVSRIAGGFFTVRATRKAYLFSLLFFFFLSLVISIFFFFLWWILSYIEMKQPWVYMCSPSQSPLPPPSPPIPSRFSQCTRSERLSHASNLGW